MRVPRPKWELLRSDMWQIRSKEADRLIKDWLASHGSSLISQAAAARSSSTVFWHNCYFVVIILTKADLRTESSSHSLKFLKWQERAMWYKEMLYVYVWRKWPHIHFKRHEFTYKDIFSTLRSSSSNMLLVFNASWLFCTNEREGSQESQKRRMD